MTRTKTTAHQRPTEAPRPSASDAAKRAARAAGIAGICTGTWWGLDRSLTMTGLTTLPDLPTHPGAVVAASTALIAGAAAVIHQVRVRGWDREGEDRRVRTALGKAVRDDNLWMRVHARDGATPVDVTVPAGGRTVTRALVAAFADAMHVDRDQVRADAARGRVRMSLADGDTAHTDRAPERAPVPEAVRAPEVKDARPPAHQDDVIERVTEALRELVDKASEVEVDQWADGFPVRLVLTYPPRATARVRENLAVITDTIERLYASRRGRWAVRWDSANDRVILTDEVDALDVPVPIPPAEPVVDVSKGVTIGITDTGEPWRVPLGGGRQVLVAGATGAGKGSILWGVVAGLEHMIRDGSVRLWIADPKGGAEFDTAEPYAHRMESSPEGIVDLLEDAVATMQRKTAQLRRLKMRKIETPTPDLPLDLVVIDELAAVVGQGALDAAQSKRATASMVLLLTQGRAPAFTVLGAVQDPRKENLRQRNLFTYTIALRLSEAGETDLVLGRSVRATGATADLIPENLPGVAYVVTDGRAGFVRARAAFHDDPDTEALATRLSPDAEVAELRTPTSERPVAVVVTPPAPAVTEAHDETTVDETTVDELSRGDVVLLPDEHDTDPVRIDSVEDDPDYPDDRVVAYRYLDAPDRSPLRRGSFPATETVRFHR